jgi:hypothetical protein
MNATPHVGQNMSGRSSAIDGRTAARGLCCQPAAAAAYNLARLPKLLEAPA